MVKLDKANEEDCYYSQVTSELVRNLGYAGLAIVWIFKKDLPDDAGIQIPRPLIWASLGIITTLALDCIQYFYASCLWGRAHDKHEAICKQQGDNRDKYEFENPKWMVDLIDWIWLVKLIPIPLAYSFIFYYIICELAK